MSSSFSRSECDSSAFERFSDSSVFGRSSGLSAHRRSSDSPALRRDSDIDEREWAALSNGSDSPMTEAPSQVEQMMQASVFGR